jgi:hypothetical protein
MLTQYPSEKMAMYKVRKEVNKAGNEGAQLMQPVPELF